MNRLKYEIGMERFGLFIFEHFHTACVQLQEAFNILTKYAISVEREYYDQVDSLRDTFNKLLERALQSQCKLLGE